MIISAAIIEGCSIFVCVTSRVIIRERAQRSEHVHNASAISRAVAESVIDRISVGVVEMHLTDSRLERMRESESGGGKKDGWRGRVKWRVARRVEPSRLSQSTLQRSTVRSSCALASTRVKCS